MNLLYLAFSILCVVALSQIITYMVFRNSMPSFPGDHEKSSEYKLFLDFITKYYILSPFIINFFLLVSIGSCLAMNCTRWWFIFWIILFGILPHFFIMYTLITIQSQMDNMDIIRDAIVAMFPGDEEKSSEIKDYLDNLKYAMVAIITLQLISFIFLFVSIITNKKFRLPSPKVVHQYTKIMNNSQRAKEFKY